MNASHETAFERDLRERMADADFRDAFERESVRIDTIDRLVNAIDEARVELGMSKADLARAIDADPAAVRRLLGDTQPNPRLETVAALAHAVGLDVTLTPCRHGRGPSTDANRPGRLQHAS